MWLIHTDSVADPGFSRGEKVLLLLNFFAENCMKMEESKPRGGGGTRPWRPPLDPPMLLISPETPESPLNRNLWGRPGPISYFHAVFSKNNRSLPQTQGLTPCSRKSWIRHATGDGNVHFASKRTIVPTLPWRPSFFMTYLKGYAKV